MQLRSSIVSNHDCDRAGSCFPLIFCRMKILRQMGELIIMCTITALLLSLTFLGPVLCILTENPLKVMYYRGRAWRVRLIEWRKRTREKRSKEALNMANTGANASQLRRAVLAIATDLEKEGIVSKDPEPSRFVSEPFSLVFGSPEVAAGGMAAHMRIEQSLLFSRLAQGVSAIVQEVSRFGTDEDKECLEYVLYKEAGSDVPIQDGWDGWFVNGKRDCDRHGRLLESRKRPDGTGMRLADFVAHKNVIASNLNEAHVVALRLYSTAAFKSLNTPLRRLGEDAEPHKMPVTVALIDDAVKKLRSVDASQGLGKMDLFRGMSNVKVSKELYEKGGAELAPMSTTPNLGVAIEYASGGEHAVIMRLRTTSHMNRGADISFLSAFPSEEEILFPPLTYLRPLGTMRVKKGKRNYVIVDVEPQL